MERCLTPLTGSPNPTIWPSEVGMRKRGRGKAREVKTIESQSGFMYWGESEGWGIAATQHRDSEPLERSNFAVIRRDIESHDPQNVTVESVRSDFVGWIEFLLVRPDSEAWRIADDWRSRLADYPVADDENLSETEEAESIESIEEFLRSEFAWHEIDYAECAAYVVSAWMESGTRDLPGMTYTGWPQMDQAEEIAPWWRLASAHGATRRGGKRPSLEACGGNPYTCGPARGRVENTERQEPNVKAIITTYHGPTDARGSRIVAREPDGKRISFPYDHALTSEANHREAAKALCVKLNWPGEYVMAWTATGYVHCDVYGQRWAVTTTDNA